MPFQYSNYESPYANTIAQLIARQNDPFAEAARTRGALTSRAMEIGGQATGDMIRGITNAGTSLVNTLVEAQQKAPAVALQKLQVQERQQEMGAKQALSSGLEADTLRQTTGSQPLAAGDVGPQLPQLTDKDGSYDLPAIGKYLNARGYGAHAPEMLQHLQATNLSVLEAKQKQKAAGDAQTVAVGMSAFTMKNALALGLTPEQAYEAGSQPMARQGLFTPEEMAKNKEHLLSLTPEQLDATLTTMMDQAAQIGPKTKLSEGQIEKDMFGRTTAKGEPKPMDLEDVIVKVNGINTTLQRDKHTGTYYNPDMTKFTGSFDPYIKGDKLTDKERDEQAYGAMIGKKPGEPLTFPERVKMDAALKDVQKAAEFEEFKRQHDYAAANPIPVRGKSQDQLESEMRQGVRLAFSNRSGGIGREDQKVLQANHALQLMHDAYDPATKTYNIPPANYTDLALSVAQLMSPTGNVGVQLVDELKQPTLAGDLGKALTYATGRVYNGTTQEIAKQLYQTILRQGQVASENRDIELGNLRGAVTPTDLEESRRKKIEDNLALVPLRQSKEQYNPTTKQWRMLISTDGGKTWK